MNEIEILSEKLRMAREAYYNLDPIISDQEYDILLEKLKQLDPKNSELRAVGASSPTESSFIKVKHQIPMGSLNKVNTFEEFLGWSSNRFKKSEMFVSHKVDGLSMELVYTGGKLTQAVTRGDGITGEDVTYNVQMILDIPKNIAVSDCIIRGEVVMLKETFNSQFASIYANPRNTAAAKIREKKKADCTSLNFRAYYIKEMGRNFNLISEQFEYLRSLGFSTPSLSKACSTDELKEIYDLVIDNRSDIEYEIDGLVVSTNDTVELEYLGEVNMRPEGAIALKFPSQMGVTKAVEIKWQSGPTGRITPVLIVEPIEIGGVSISRVSLQNLSAFRALRLFKGCNVLISRHNDVIPYCEKNLDDELS
jgi:DNA ligase (NAD+)